MMITSEILRGLYVITDPQLCQDKLIAQVEQALAGGARLVQYRNKTASEQEKRQQAEQLRSVCKQHQRLFIVNDDVLLAKAVDADGVHIGQQDAKIEQARTLLGEDKIIGVSCNNRLDWALSAQQRGADYVAFGRFFASHTKPDAPPADIQLLQQAHQQLQVPIVAIGGITPHNARQLVAAGADMLAVINAVFAAPNILQAAQQFQKHFSTG
ncbi:MAG: thiamine phosphate synthase [Thioalkalispiraceae bacterium]|jgi:thiamine-phosphate pyrophosphorylase